MKILGIDPGYDRLGIAIIERTLRGKEVVLYSACFQTSPKEEIHVRLEEIGREVAKILEEFEPDAMALETLFITKNQKTAMRVAEARGIMIYEAARHGVPTFEYAPMEIKVAITGDGTSDKERMMKMIDILVKMDDKKRLDDEFDAIAVALTHSAVVR